MGWSWPSTAAPRRSESHPSNERRGFSSGVEARAVRWPSTCRHEQSDGDHRSRADEADARKDTQRQTHHVHRCESVRRWPRVKSSTLAWIIETAAARQTKSVVHSPAVWPCSPRLKPMAAPQVAASAKRRATSCQVISDMDATTIQPWLAKQPFQWFNSDSSVCHTPGSRKKTALKSLSLHSSCNSMCFGVKFLGLLYL